MPTKGSTAASRRERLLKQVCSSTRPPKLEDFMDKRVQQVKRKDFVPTEHSVVSREYFVSSCSFQKSATATEAQ